LYAGSAHPAPCSEPRRFSAPDPVVLGREREQAGPVSVHVTKSDKWEARYREGRRNRSKTFDLEEDAHAFDAKARTRLQCGEHTARLRHADIERLCDRLDGTPGSRGSRRGDADDQQADLRQARGPQSRRSTGRRSQPTATRHVTTRTRRRRRQHLHAQQLKDAPWPDHGRRQASRIGVGQRGPNTLERPSGTEVRRMFGLRSERRRSRCP